MSCAKSGSACITSIPRKEKGLSLKYHLYLLQQLTSFYEPFLNVDDITSISELCRRKGIPIHSYDQFLGLKDSSPEIESRKAPFISQPSPQPSQAPTFGPLAPIREQRKVPKITDYAVERLVYDTEGRAHYVGYASTFAIFNGMCNLVAQSLEKPLSFDQHIHTYQNDAPHPEYARIKLGNVPILAMASDFLPLWTTFPNVNVILKREADFYVSVFFEKVHHYYFIFSEDKFHEKYADFWSEVSQIAALDAGLSEEERFRKIMEIRSLTSEWVFSIFLVWVLGSGVTIFPNHALSEAEAEKLISLIKLSLLGIVLKNALMSLRVLYLLSVHLYLKKNKNLAWILIGLACRQAMSLGLHRESRVLDHKFRGMISRRKQIWWSLYMFEVSMGSSFGRPTIVKNSDINVGYPTQYIYTKPTETDYLQYYVESVNLTRLLNEIFAVRSIIYNEHDQSPFSLKVVSKTLVLRKNLTDLKSSIDSRRMSLEAVIQDLKNGILRKSEIKRFRLDLTFHYHSYTIIMTLPFVLYTVNLLVVQPDSFSLLDEPIITILNGGVESAVELSRILHIYNELGILEGNLFDDMFFGYTALMTLVLVFFMLQIVDHMEKQGHDLTAWRSQFHIKDGAPITVSMVLASIYRIRIAMNTDKIIIGETIQRSIEVIEDFLKDTGIASILSRMYGEIGSQDLDTGGVWDLEGDRYARGLYTDDSYNWEDTLSLLRQANSLRQYHETEIQSLFSNSFVDEFNENSGMQVNFTDDQLREFLNEWLER